VSILRPKNDIQRKKGVTMFREISEKIPCTEKFLRWVLPRGLLMILVLVVCVFFIGNTRRIETGIVEYKLVTGKKDQIPHVLLVNMGRKNVAVAEKMKDIVHDEYAETPVDRALEDEMHRYFTDVQYNIVVRLSRDNRLKSFSVPRNVFNAAQTNSTIKYEIATPYSNKITRIVPDESRMLAVDTNHPYVSEIRHFMQQ
jgi:hypothetical protein